MCGIGTFFWLSASDWLVMLGERVVADNRPVGWGGVSSPHFLFCG